MEKLFFVFFISGSLFYIFLLMYAVKFSRSVPEAKSDAAIVLGQKSYQGGKYNPCLVARVDAGVALYKKDLVPKLLFSGGTDKEDRANEAETMKKIALEKNIPENAILLESKSTSTYENLLNSLPILEKNKFKKITIVTEPFHIYRAVLVARSLNLNFTYYPVTESPCWKKRGYFSLSFLQEPFSIMYYLLKGKIKLSSLL